MAKNKGTEEAAHEEQAAPEAGDKDAAQAALLQAITKQAGKAKDPDVLLKLAEAYAWVVEPEADH